MCQNNPSTPMPMSFMDDNRTVNALRQSRMLIGSKQKVPYQLPFRETMLALMTFNIPAPTAGALCDTALRLLEMDYNVSYVASRLNKICSDNQQPDEKWREYSKGFPAIARKAGLFRRELTASERQLELNSRMDARGLPRYVYQLKNPVVARDYLVATFPQMLGLFQAMYAHRIQGNV